MRKNTNSLSATTINNHLGTPFIELLSVDSTNNYAMQQVHKGLAKHGVAYFAHEQFRGKGQRNKEWYTTAAENIILSVVLNTSSLQVSHPCSLSFAMALAVYDFFKSYAVTNVSIKWPNDLYWRDRKAGGILIENIFRGKSWQWAIAGIGININQTKFHPSVVNAVSLKQITGKTYQSVALAKELCEQLERRYNQLLNSEAELLHSEYNSVLYKPGELVKLKRENTVFEAFVKEVNSNGQLIVEMDGAQQVYSAGEIEWVTD